MQEINVLSVNISDKKGIIKKPVDLIQLDKQGIRGDAHAGNWNRQVSLLGSESIEKFTSESGRKIIFGEFAENITTQGIKLYETHPLDRFISGSLILEVTQIGKKCHGTSCTIFKEVGNCVMPTEGIFCRVITPGKLQAGNKLEYVPKIYKVFLLTISDRASAGIYNDASGPEAVRLTTDFLNQKTLQFQISSKIIPDDPVQIKDEILESVDNHLDIIITTGGTGIGIKDFTSEVVKRLIDKEIPGIMDFIRLKYGAEKPQALISRSIAGVKNKTLIYALPGSLNAVKEYLEEINKTILHSIYMLHGLDIH